MIEQYITPRTSHSGPTVARTFSTRHDATAHAMRLARKYPRTGYILVLKNCAPPQYNLIACITHDDNGHEYITPLRLGNVVE